MFDSAQLCLFRVSSILPALTPGPDILTVIARGGVSQGRKPALVSVAGFTLSCINHTLILVIGIAVLLKALPTAFNIIKYIGAAYLAYIGIQIIRHPKHVRTLHSKKEAGLKKTFRQSILANLLNPKVALFFLAFLPKSVNPTYGHENLQLL